MWTDIVTALSTLGLLIIGLFGLKSLRIAARALQVETDPVIVIDERGLVDGTLDAAYDILFDQQGTPQFRDILNENGPALFPIEGTVMVSRIDPSLPVATLRVRNVGRSAAIGLRLIAHIAVGGRSNGLSIPLTFIGANEERFIHFRNLTGAKVFVRFFSVAHHQPQDRPSLLYRRGYLAIRLRLGKIPGFANTRLYRWMLQHREKPHKSLYVYSATTTIVRAAAAGGEA